MYGLPNVAIGLKRYESSGLSKKESFFGRRIAFAAKQRKQVPRTPLLSFNWAHKLDSAGIIADLIAPRERSRALSIDARANGITKHVRGSCRNEMRAGSQFGRGGKLSCLLSDRLRIAIATFPHCDLSIG
jgi:hypothetical protein